MRIGILAVVAIALALILMVVPGCSPGETPEDPPAGNGEPQNPDPPPGDNLAQPDPPSGTDEPQTPEPGDTPGESPAPEPEVLALDKTDIRTLEFEPTAGDFMINRQYISFYIPANVEVLNLVDIFDADYPLPDSEVVMPTMEGAVWRAGNLYYLSRSGWPSDEPVDPVLFAYNPDLHTAKDYQLNFPDSFSPQCFFVDWNDETRNVDAIFVGETGSYQFSLATGAMEELAEFSLDPGILDRAVWHPYKPQLSYSEGNQLKLIDILTGKVSVLYEAPGDISEFCWGYSDNIALLVGNRLEKIDGYGGRYLDSITVDEGAYSLGLVPLLEMICYLVPAEGSGLPTLVIEDLENNLRYIYQGCMGYTWTYLNKLWTYWESPEQDTTTLVYSHIQWNPDQARPGGIPERYLNNPRLPDTHAQGDIEKIAGDLFCMYMEGLKSEGSITDFELHDSTFQREELGGFRVSVSYSVQSDDTISWVSGDGELGEDGWVHNKNFWIDIYQDGSSFLLGELSSHP